MPPKTSADNGGFAWFVTIRPKPEHFNEQLEDDVIKYVETKLKPDWWLLVKEKGNHLHCAVFMHDPEQRSNFVTKWLNNPLKNYEDEEKKNFRRYDREKKSGAVLQMTTLGTVVEYLSGDYGDKAEDEFEVLSEKLPPVEDISELEEYLPAVNGLKRKRQMSVWYAELEEDFKEKHPDITVMTEALALRYVQRRMFCLRDMEVMADQRILRQKLRSFVSYFNQEVSGFYTDYKGGVFPLDEHFPHNVD